MGFADSIFFYYWAGKSNWIAASTWLDEVVTPALASAQAACCMFHLTTDTILQLPTLMPTGALADLLGHTNRPWIAAAIYDLFNRPTQSPELTASGVAFDFLNTATGLLPQEAPELWPTFSRDLAR